MVIDINIFAFYITSAACDDFSIYKRWLGNLDWPKEIFKLEDLNLNLFRVQKLWS